jgi:hypothetical protein
MSKSDLRQRFDARINDKIDRASQAQALARRHADQARYNRVDSDFDPVGQRKPNGRVMTPAATVKSPSSYERVMERRVNMLDTDRGARMMEQMVKTQQRAAAARTGRVAAVAALAGGIYYLASGKAKAAEAPSGQTRTAPYIDSHGRNYANGRLITRKGK